MQKKFNAEDFLSSSPSMKNSQDSNDVELIDVCECESGEFRFAAEYVLTRNLINKVTFEDINITDMPDYVLWPSILSAIESCTDFPQAEKIAHKLHAELPPLEPRVYAPFDSYRDVLDLVAQKEIPPDGPRKLKAVVTDSDSNCLSQSLGRGFFNDASKHLELRARLVIEGIVNKDKYLSDDCLERGASWIHENADLPKVFTTFSEYYTPGQKITADTIESIYCLEIHSCA